MKKLYFLMSLLLFCSSNHAQVIVETVVQSINASGGVKLGPDGRIYIGNFGQSLDNANGTEVWRLNKDQSVELFATGLSGASGNDFDSKGFFYQSNISSGTVSKISSGGEVSLFASNGISCNVGIAIDDTDNIYICNCCGTNGNTISKISSTGITSTFSSGPLFNCPNGITLDSKQNLYVSNFSNGNIIKINPQGIPTLFATTPGTATTSASNGHITYSEKENVLYVSSHGAHRIYKLSMTGVLEVLAGDGTRGNTDGMASEASFSRPNGLALSVTGDSLFINSSIPTTDSGGRPLNPSKIRMISGLLENQVSIDRLPDLDSVLSVYPNPSDDRATIEIHLQEKAKVNLDLLDVNSKIISEIENSELPAGVHLKNLITDQLHSGSYILMCQIDDYVISKIINVIHE